MTKLKNVRIVILKVLTHVRTHPEELLVSKIWISCFLFRLRLLARVKRKERSCTGRNGNTLHHWMRSCLALLKTTRRRDYDRNFHGKAVKRQEERKCQHKHEASFLCAEAKSSSKRRNGNTVQHGIAQLIEVLKTTRERTLHAKCLENNIVLGKKKRCVTTSTTKEN